MVNRASKICISNNNTNKKNDAIDAVHAINTTSVIDAANATNIAIVTSDVDTARAFNTANATSATSIIDFFNTASIISAATSNLVNAISIICIYEIDKADIGNSQNAGDTHNNNISANIYYF